MKILGTQSQSIFIHLVTLVTHLKSTSIELKNIIEMNTYESFSKTVMSNLQHRKKAPSKKEILMNYLSNDGTDPTLII